ncbi:hypothetical protein O6H91_07G131100 [Diphasiastrum complanatum]|uniref:Uncharacterized protein n=1 Tax=Diphasiastrum complanatum TaxID=34168 RepID=A0ACC2D9K8_DIPCM|nr:hypothetical protein O6H91_07G131100 [Diphasiastrum complanatum]
MPAGLCSPVISLATGAHARASSLDGRCLVLPSSAHCTSQFYASAGKVSRTSHALSIRQFASNARTSPGKIFPVCVAAQQNTSHSTRDATGVEQQKSSVFKSETASSRGTSGATSSGVGVPSVPPSTSPYFGSPMLWIGVGVGLSVIFSWAANSFKRYAMQQVFKSMLGQSASSGNESGGFPMPPGNQFGGFPVPPGSPFPFPPSTPGVAPPGSSFANTAAPASTTIDVPATEISTTSGTREKFDESTVQTKKPAFTDVDPEVLLEQRQTLSNSYSKAQDLKLEAAVPNMLSECEQVSKEETNSNQSLAKEAAFNASNEKPSLFTIEMLERMMDDPTIQNMVYPYLPEEMRNPSTYKWMMQNPQYRQQLQEMLNSMSEGGAWDSRMSDLLKNFDLNTKDVKQQFEQLGVSPEEAIAKVMANPDVAVAFQNPKVQAAIMDCSANPLNIAKYQNDKEVMDVFNKISELFPGMSASPF